MLNRAATCFAFSNDSAAGGVNHVLGNRLNDGFAGQVNALNFITVIFGGRIEGDGQTETCVKSFSVEGKTSCQSLLFEHILFCCAFQPPRTVV